MKLFATFIIALWIVLSVYNTILLAQVDSQIQAYRDEPYGNAIERRRGIMDGNLVRTMYYNQGEIAHWPDQPSGEWPNGSGHSYIDGICVLIGAKVPVNIAGIDTFITPIESAYREHYDRDPVTGTPWGLEPVPGYFNFDVSNSAPAISNNINSWPNVWPRALPNVDENWDGHWYGYYGKGKLNADQEIFFVMDDAADKEWCGWPYEYYPIEADSSRGGLGLRVEVRAFQWNHPLAEDIMIWHYDVINISDYTYNEMVFGLLGDVGIGGTQDSGDDCVFYDSEHDLVYAYDFDGIGNNDYGNWSPTGYLGFAFLETPGNATNGFDDDSDGMVDERRDDGIDNDNDWIGYIDVNGNGQWDENQNEPLKDDVGHDGIGPLDSLYNGPDEGEGDGLPTDGEPNFDRLDPDESDQIDNSISFDAYRFVDGGGGDGWPKHDQGLWRRLSSDSIDTEGIERANIHATIGTGPFLLESGKRERFSVAIILGDDLDDLIQNKLIAEQIFENDYKLPDNLVDLDGNQNFNHPASFILSQNYPNPFNPSTIIGYRLFKTNNVELNIYNTLGQKVKQLLKAGQTAGDYEISWNGKNELGINVPSGIYFYRLQAGDFIQTNKMILMK